MAKENVSLQAFNRGLISPLALARTDLDRMRWSAERQHNWIPRTLGSMMLRPGFGYIGSGRNNLAAKHIPFFFAADDTAIIELTDSTMRVRGHDEQLVTRTAAAFSITNGTFDSDLTGWTDADELGATSAWRTGGYMGLSGTEYTSAKRYQYIDVAGSSAGIALNIVIARGRVNLRYGTTVGSDNLVSQTTLAEGTHSISIPNTSGYLEFSATTRYYSLVDSVSVAASGVMEVATPWVADNLRYLRHDQSADVVFVDCFGVQQRRIERRGTGSWSVVKYLPEDGPFRIINTSSVRLTPSAINGDITLTASQNFFQSGHVGALFRLTSVGQRVEDSVSGADQWSAPIRVTGVGAQRTFRYIISGTWAGTLTLQRSVSQTGAWEDVQSVTTTAGTDYNDSQTNQIIFYRIGFKTGNYTSGTANIVLSYASGGLTGIVRVTGYTSETSVSAVVLKSLGGVNATEDWSEGMWSDFRGWPSAPVIHQGRLWNMGKGYEVGSISDAYESFDDTVEGDAGPIIRTIGSGPVDNIFWAMSLKRLMAGTASSVVVAQSSSLDEPLTPTQFSLNTPVTKGAANVPPVKIDSNGIFVSATGTRLVELALDATQYDYGQNDLTRLCPEVGVSKYMTLAVQREPDTRVLSVLGDGTLAPLVYDPVEDVRCVVTQGTDGVVEDTFVLPGYEDMEEDRVYYYVARQVGGSTVRYLERQAMESECQGDTISKLADSFIVYEGSATNVIPGVSHLAGEEVVVWADGIDLSPDDAEGVQKLYTVAVDGTVTLDEGVTVENAVVGLPYQAVFKSTKLAYASNMGSALTQRKRVHYLGLVMANTHARGLKFGPSLDRLDSLPMVEQGAEVDPDHIWESYDMDATVFNGEYDTDSRIFLVAQAPRCCTLQAAIVGMQTHDKT